nr:unnamed protein product [Callosobruchus analis]
MGQFAIACINRLRPA